VLIATRYYSISFRPKTSWSSLSESCAITLPSLANRFHQNIKITYANEESSYMGLIEQVNDAGYDSHPFIN